MKIDDVINEGPLDFAKGVAGSIAAKRAKPGGKIQKWGQKTLAKSADAHAISKAPTRKKKSGMTKVVQAKWQDQKTKLKNPTVDDFNSWMGNFFAKYNYQPMDSDDINDAEDYIAQTVNKSAGKQQAVAPTQAAAPTQGGVTNKEIGNDLNKAADKLDTTAQNKKSGIGQAAATAAVGAVGNQVSKAAKQVKQKQRPSSDKEKKAAHAAWVAKQQGQNTPKSQTRSSKQPSDHERRIAQKKKQAKIRQSSDQPNANQYIGSKQEKIAAKRAKLQARRDKDVAKRDKTDQKAATKQEKIAAKRAKLQARRDKDVAKRDKADQKAATKQEKEAYKQEKIAAKRAKLQARRDKDVAKKDKKAIKRDKKAAKRDKKAIKRDKDAAKRAKLQARRDKDVTKRDKDAAKRAKLQARRDKDVTKRNKVQNRQPSFAKKQEPGIHKTINKAKGEHSNLATKKKRNLAKRAKDVAGRKKSGGIHDTIRQAGNESKDTISLDQLTESDLIILGTSSFLEERFTK